MGIFSYWSIPYLCVGLILIICYNPMRSAFFFQGTSLFNSLNSGLLMSAIQLNAEEKLIISQDRQEISMRQSRPTGSRSLFLPLSNRLIP
jgi:hypothetical protein